MADPICHYKKVSASVSALLSFVLFYVIMQAIPMLSCGGMKLAGCFPCVPYVSPAPAPSRRACTHAYLCSLFAQLLSW